MALPSLISTRGQRRNPHTHSFSSSSQDHPPNNNPHAPPQHPTHSTIKAATRTRLLFSLLTSLLYLIALIFLILVEIGSTSSRPLIQTIYFLKLDLSHIIPQSVPQATLINSIARTLGLHDFYQVGLWGYCEGYAAEGITGCSTPRALYWFNPVQIILSVLLSGATIALPSTIIEALELVRLASHWMFGLFLAGAACCFVAVFLTPFSIYTRWATFPIAIFAFLTALATTAANVIGTVMFIIFRNVVQGAEETVNIVPEIGMEMFAFMWVASACAITGWLVQMGMCCYCASRRDVGRGKKRGRRRAWRVSGEVAPYEEERGGGGKKA